MTVDSLAGEAHQLVNGRAADLATVAQPSTAPMTRVLIAVASEVVRSGLCAMLASLPGVRAQECTDLAAILDSLGSGVFGVVVMSPPMDGDDYRAVVEAAAHAKARTVVLLRDYDVSDQDVISQAVALPADGYILESGLTTASLADTLQRLYQGQAPMPTMLARGLITRLRAAEPKAERPFLLTARELQVLSLLVDGQSNKEIARHLKVSEHGAKRHVAGVLAKLNCSNRTAAVALVLQKGIFNPPTAG
jgi:two-component system nitrate/nitrite response regulator NarL